MRRPFVTLCAVAALALLSLTTPLGAVGLTWDHDADGTASDGAGAWLGASQWLNGGTPATWNSVTPDDATIGSGGSGGDLDLTGGVTVGTATFDNFSGTYKLSNGILTVNTELILGPNAGKVHFQSTSGLAGTGDVTLNGQYPTTKEGPSQLSFWQLPTAQNTLSGTYNVNGGILFTQGGQLPDASSTVILNGGAGALDGAAYSSRWGGTMNRNLGTGSGEIQVTGGRSGFEGQGTTGMTVRLNNDATTPIVWGSANFQAA